MSFLYVLFQQKQAITLNFSNISPSGVNNYQGPAVASRTECLMLSPKHCDKDRGVRVRDAEAIPDQIHVQIHTGRSEKLAK